MYLTAYLVRSGTGSEGINCFLHRHEEVEWPDDVSAFPEQNPGTIVDEKISVMPGGNRVRAYLDVLGPESLTLREIEQAVSALRDDLLERRNPTVFREGRVTVRFGTELGLDSMRVRYLEMLQKEALALLPKPGKHLRKQKG